jgi:4a-hydroxytetrahydrobiopterin dehydratase
MHTDLLHDRCRELPPGTPALEGNELSELVTRLHGWGIEDRTLTKEYRFANYYETLAFVNATAIVSHKENHHPDLEVSYNRVRVKYSTHSVGGLSRNDFICAAKIDAIVNL